MSQREHIHTVTCERGGEIIPARRLFRAKHETNYVETVPAGAVAHVIELPPLDRERIVALHVGSKLRDCPLVPPPVCSWGRGDERPCPQAFLTSNPSDQDVEVHVSLLFD